MTTKTSATLFVVSMVVLTQMIEIDEEDFQEAGWTSDVFIYKRRFCYWMMCRPWQTVNKSWWAEIWFTLTGRWLYLDIQGTWFASVTNLVRYHWRYHWWYSVCCQRRKEGFYEQDPFSIFLTLEQRQNKAEWIRQDELMSNHFRKLSGLSARRASNHLKIGSGISHDGWTTWIWF